VIIISHRGNLNGPKPKLENDPASVIGTLDRGLLCEIDVWYIKNKWYLGHDYPKYPVKWNFFISHETNIICHAKNTAALEKLLDRGFHVFMHKSDPMVLTSLGWVVCMHYAAWPKDRAVVMFPELLSPKLLAASKPFAICTDYPVKYLQDEW
jgi:hypothetical protein